MKRRDHQAGGHFRLQYTLTDICIHLTTSSPGYSYTTPSTALWLLNHPPAYPLTTAPPLTWML